MEVYFVTNGLAFFSRALSVYGRVMCPVVEYCLRARVVCAVGVNVVRYDFHKGISTF